MPKSTLLAPAYRGAAMVRLVLVRHAQSTQNAYMETVMERMVRGELDGRGFNKAMRDGGPGTAAGEDAPLTALGAAQSGRLGETWAPLLAAKARAGKLRCFVSPFLRTLQTADPLMRRLQAEAPGLEAVLLPAIMEAGGLTAAEDFKLFDRIDELNKQGKRKEAVQFLKSIKWKPQGMTGDEIRAKFGWARRASPADMQLIGTGVSASVPADMPWWTEGFESRTRAEKRVHKAVEWIMNSLRTQLPDDAVVLMVAHGQMIAQTANSLSHRAFTGKPEENADMSYEGIRNTSVTSFLLPSPSYGYPGERPDNTGNTIRYRCKLELFNDTGHLGDEQLRLFATAALGARL